MNSTASSCPAGSPTRTTCAPIRRRCSSCRDFFAAGKPVGVICHGPGRWSRPTWSRAASSPPGRACRPTCATPAPSGSTRKSSSTRAWSPAANRTISKRSTRRSSRSSRRGSMPPAELKKAANATASTKRSKRARKKRGGRPNAPRRSRRARSTRKKPARVSRNPPRAAPNAALGEQPRRQTVGQRPRRPHPRPALQRRQEARHRRPLEDVEGPQAAEGVRGRLSPRHRLPGSQPPPGGASKAAIAVTIGMPASPPSRSRLSVATVISSRRARSRISAVSRQPCSSTIDRHPVEGGVLARVDRVGVDRRADLGDEGAQRFVGHPAADRDRRPAPVLVADERARPGGVEVLDRAALGLGADLFDAFDLEQGVGVVGDDAEALEEFARQFGRARGPAL